MSARKGRPKPPPIHTHEYVNYARVWDTIAVWQGRATGQWYVNNGTYYLGRFPREEWEQARSLAVRAADAR